MRREWDQIEMGLRFNEKVLPKLTYRFIFLWCEVCLLLIELLIKLLGLDWLLCTLLLPIRLIVFSFDGRRLFVTITLEAPSNRSFRLSPTTRKLGNRIQHVLTVQLPDIPWHLHSCRISACTCCYVSITDRSWEFNHVRREKKGKKILVSSLHELYNSYGSSFFLASAHFYYF